MGDFFCQIENKYLVTAEIIYYLPDHPQILQSYIWQEYDSSLTYPKLRRFLHFWEENLDGKMHSVTVTSQPLFPVIPFRVIHASFSVH